MLDEGIIAVNNNGGALYYASEELREDIEFVRTVLGTNGSALEYTSEYVKGYFRTVAIIGEI